MEPLTFQSSAHSGTPTRATVRQTLGAILVSDSDLCAFCLDYFPEVYRRFSQTMDRTTKENLLLGHASVENIISCLRFADTRPLHLPPLVEPCEPVVMRSDSSSVPEIVRSALPGSTGRQPPRGAFDTNWYVRRPDQEHKAGNALSYRTPVVLYGPELYGKTWLLHTILGAAEGKGYRVASLNLRLFEQEACSSLPRFLHKVAFRLLKELDLPADVVDNVFAASQGGPIDSLNEIMRHVLRRRPDIRLVLAIDNVDQIAAAGHKYQDEFFSLLRAWADASDGDWVRLHLVLCISTAPALLINEPHRSPFNLGDVIYLPDFDDSQLHSLAALHGLSVRQTELTRLRELVGGHPYLTRLALYEAWGQQRPLSDVLDRADGDAPDGVFNGYLEHLRRRLHAYPAVWNALVSVVANPFAIIDEDARRRLDKAGILLRERRDGRAANRLRHRIYQFLVP